MARVLLVCDEPEVAKALQLILDDAHTVEYAPSGHDVLLRIAAKESFDVIFSDVDLPDMRGKTLKMELARRWPAVAKRLVFLPGTKGWRRNLKPT
jgi:CheY-like chemotaxis protein